MPRLRFLSIPLALLAISTTASAQHRSGGSTVTSAAPPVNAARQTAHQPTTAAWTGTPSKWGGSPPQARHDRRSQFGYIVPDNAYIPVAVAAPEPVPATYAADPGCPPSAAPIQMPVITTQHEERQLTTIEVYRLQPRFQRP